MMEFVVKYKYTFFFVSDVSRVDFRIEKTTDIKQARIFDDNWIDFWKSLDSYEVITRKRLNDVG